MKNSIVAAIGIALVAGTVPVAAEAGPFDKLKKMTKKVKEKAAVVEAVAEEVKRAEETNGRSVAERAIGVAAGSVSGPVVLTKTGRSGSDCNQNVSAMSNYPCTARRPAHAGRAAAAPAKYVSQIQCANVGLGNAFIGRSGNYTFSQGISTQERGGVIDRAYVEPTNGCYFPGLAVGDILYVEFDKAKYSAHKYKIQCVSYDGSEQLDNTFGPRINNYTGKDIMLHTGNSVGYEPTATGSNSDRSGAYDAYLSKRGRTFATFNFQERHDDKSGTDFFCQWFDQSSGKSALAMAFRRGPQG